MYAKQIAEILVDAKKVVVLTGAGMSTNSGLADFRSNGGLWDGRDPFDISHVSKVGTPEFVDFFKARMEDVHTHEPNEGHRILEKWKRDVNLKIITQNIDGYHGEEAIEMHGHLRYVCCDTCGRRFSTSFYRGLRNDKCINPTCEQGHIRPQVILFGEGVDINKWTKAMGEVLTADVILVLGTSLEVRPFSDLIEIAFTNRARTIICTKSTTPYDTKFSYRSHGDITEFLKEIDLHVQQYSYVKQKDTP